ncbi:MAG: hypothetical protein K8F36_15185 [Melioribacteraceae bacterium]|nr:hypothetical protein [Melioribacteraceae bacterium]MCO6472387.1 hypothetical protein [Melioribacteraceae bacterium]
MGRALIIILFGTMSFYLMANLSTNERLNTALESSVTYFSKTQARNIANSVVQMQISKLADSTDYRVPNETSTSMFNGTGYYMIKDTTIGTTNLIKVRARGVYFDEQYVAEAIVEPASSGFTPASVLAAITTNNPVRTLGTLVVDGREHDIDGNLVANSGTLGLWTTSSYSRGGNSKVGGTTGGNDYEPDRRYESGTVATNQTYPGGFPTSPDSILGGSAEGFPPGYLKAIAQSGANGSQYTTNPNTLTTPLKGVTFVELPDGGTWNPANITGEGILIVHNSNLNAAIKNINHGTFKGLVIADDIIHIHNDIIGAVIALSPSPSDGNCIGNGQGNVLYSSEAIQNATGKALGGGTPNNYGFAATRLSLRSYYE